MSYRALLTIVDETVSGEGFRTRHFKMFLDECFTSGEMIAAELGRQRTFDNALAAMPDQALRWGMKAPRDAGADLQTLHDVATWKQLYADQAWTVTFRQDPGAETSTVSVTGKDAQERLIFFRRTRYATDIQLEPA